MPADLFTTELEADALLGALEDIALSGHDPESMTLVRLADGRVRILPADSTAERLCRLRNECGPLSAAFRVGSTRDAQGLELCVEDWTGREPLRYARRPAEPQRRLSRNAAIFFASFGITTGALPNVDVSLSPPGVSNSPVW